MKKYILLYLIIPFFSIAQQPAETIQRFFDAYSAGNKAGMQEAISPDFKLVENGEIWTIDTLI
ncbi:MAG: hypothetical protein RIS42_1196, partial [Bacteroidota bacterium]